MSELYVSVWTELQFIIFIPAAPTPCPTSAIGRPSPFLELERLAYPGDDSSEKRDTSHVRCAVYSRSPVTSSTTQESQELWESHVQQLSLIYTLLLCSKLTGCYFTYKTNFWPYYHLLDDRILVYELNSFSDGISCSNWPDVNVNIWLIFGLIILLKNRRALLYLFDPFSLPFSWSKTLLLYLSYPCSIQFSCSNWPDYTVRLPLLETYCACVSHLKSAWITYLTSRNLSDLITALPKARETKSIITSLLFVERAFFISFCYNKDPANGG